MEETMHKIPLNLVKPSPNPIRKTWDEQKMQELAQSIKEQGVIVPIKVRPSDDIEPCRVHGWNGVDGEGGIDDRGTGFTCEGCLNAIVAPDELEDWLEDGLDPRFEVVYGHRRVEAARRAGLDEIPAIVEGVEDTGVVVQALIENVVREDMKPYEKALGLQRLVDVFGLTHQAIADSLGWKSRRSVGNHLALLRPELAVTGIEQIEDAQVFWQAQAGLGERHQDALPSIVGKAINQDLNRKETRAVANAYAKAQTPELKQAIAEMKVAGRNVADGQEVRREKAFQEFDSAVKDFLDSVKMFDRMIAAATKAAKYGKFSPEAKPFTVRKIDRLIEELETLKEELTNG
jgi:ParB-like chromosome segregation protein Spo0J